MKKNHSGSVAIPGIIKHILCCALVGFPLFWILNFYVGSITTQEVEAVAFAATLVFLGGVYLGRAFVLLWSPSNKLIFSILLFFLAAIIFVSSFSLSMFAGDRFAEHIEKAFFLVVCPFMLLSVSCGMFVKLIVLNIERQLQKAEAEAAHNRSELLLLQAQLSPHFLFNTLNNLYGISLTQHQKIPNLLLKLSELLRYTVYGSKESFVPLQDEIAYLNNYIAFEKIRMGDRLHLTSSMETVADRKIGIGPMLLIVFIENAFKHARSSSEAYIFIDIKLFVNADNIQFLVKNSFEMPGNAADSKSEGGLGLENVTKRLSLLYPETHKIQLYEKDSFFNVSLQLKIKQL